jgi:translation elongation factor EF-G
VFENAILGNAIPPEYINACRKGFEEATQKGALIGHPVQGVKVVLTDGQVRGTHYHQDCLCVLRVCVRASVPNCVFVCLCVCVCVCVCVRLAV